MCMLVTTFLVYKKIMKNKKALTNFPKVVDEKYINFHWSKGSTTESHELHFSKIHGGYYLYGLWVCMILHALGLHVFALQIYDLASA